MSALECSVSDPEPSGMRGRPVHGQERVREGRGAADRVAGVGRRDERPGREGDKVGPGFECAAAGMKLGTPTDPLPPKRTPIVRDPGAPAGPAGPWGPAAPSVFHWSVASLFPQAVDRLTLLIMPLLVLTQA